MYYYIHTLKIACSVRRWRSVKTKRGFLGAAECSETMGRESSFRLQVAKKQKIHIHKVKLGYRYLCRYIICINN